MYIAMARHRSIVFVFILLVYVLFLSNQKEPRIIRTDRILIIYSKGVGEGYLYCENISMTQSIHISNPFYILALEQD